MHCKLHYLYKAFDLLIERFLVALSSVLLIELSHANKKFYQTRGQSLKYKTYPWRSNFSESMVAASRFVCPGNILYKQWWIFSSCLKVSSEQFGAGKGVGRILVR